MPNDWGTRLLCALSAAGVHTAMARTEHFSRLPPGPTCAACCTILQPGETISAPCGDDWCLPCLTTHITISFKDEEQYPARCCGLRLLASKKILNFLPKDLQRETNARKLELETKDRTYCHRPTCSAFIAPHSIHHGEAICQKCRARTCAKCKNVAHWGPCTYSEEAELLALAKEERWRRCPVCRRLVEKDEGCDDMR